MNPLFILPFYRKGMPVDSMLFYHYGLAILILGTLMKVQGQSFTLKRSGTLPLIAGGLLLSTSSLLLFLSYKHMDAGIASTILFICPTMVALIMFLFFHGKASLLTIFCILLTLSGIELLYKGEGDETPNLVGILLAILSSLSYAVYIVGVNHSTLKLMSTAKLTFYALLFGLSAHIVRLNFYVDLQAIPSFPAWGNILVMTFLPTAIPLVYMVISTRNTGSTPTVIPEASGPVTALFFGVMISDKRLTPRLALGILIIPVAVMSIVADEPLTTFIEGELARGVKKKLMR